MGVSGYRRTTTKIILKKISSSTTDAAHGHVHYSPNCRMCLFEKVHARYPRCPDTLDTSRFSNTTGERLAKIAKEKGMLLMVCDQCAVRRNLAEGTFEQCGSGEVTAKGLVDGVQAGCFPQLYQALGSNPPDQVITL